VLRLHGQKWVALMLVSGCQMVCCFAIGYGWRMPCSLLGALVFTMVRYFMMVGGESIYTIAGVALRANVTLRVSVWDH
jgi:hypothetical protein